MPAEAPAGSASTAARVDCSPSRRSQRTAQTASAISSPASGSAAHTPGSSSSSQAPTTRSDTQIMAAASKARMTRSRRTC
ncbi:Uncharacterised protein [Bordetella pertussis]|nr:Uncharacterised protein [Bordetella pertussis]